MTNNTKSGFDTKEKKGQAAGFVCKRCGEPSPVGIGYVSYADNAERKSRHLTRCACGYSCKPEAGH